MPTFFLSGLMSPRCLLLCFGISSENPNGNLNVTLDLNDGAEIIPTCLASLGPLHANAFSSSTLSFAKGQSAPFSSLR